MTVLNSRRLPGIRKREAHTCHVNDLLSASESGFELSMAKDATSIYTCSEK